MNRREIMEAVDDGSNAVENIDVCPICGEDGLVSNNPTEQFVGKPIHDYYTSACWDFEMGLVVFHGRFDDE